MLNRHYNMHNFLTKLRNVAMASNITNAVVQAIEGFYLVNLLTNVQHIMLTNKCHFIQSENDPRFSHLISQFSTRS